MGGRNKHTHRDIELSLTRVSQPLRMYLYKLNAMKIDESVRQMFFFLLLGRDAENEELSTTSHRFVDVSVFPILHPSTYTNTSTEYDTTNRSQHAFDDLYERLYYSRRRSHQLITDTHASYLLFLCFFMLRIFPSSHPIAHLASFIFYTSAVTSYQRTHVFSCVSIFLFSSHTFLFPHE